MRFSAKLGRFAEAAGRLELLRSGTGPRAMSSRPWPGRTLGQVNGPGRRKPLPRQSGKTRIAWTNSSTWWSFMPTGWMNPSGPSECSTTWQPPRARLASGTSSAVGAMCRLAVLLDARGQSHEADGLMQRVEREQGGLGSWTAPGHRHRFPSPSIAGRRTWPARRRWPATSRDYRDFLWLAQILEKAGLDEQVEATLRRAAAPRRRRRCLGGPRRVPGRQRRKAPGRSGAARSRPTFARARRLTSSWPGAMRLSGTGSSRISWRWQSRPMIRPLSCTPPVFA